MMSTARGLRNRIVPAAVEIARKGAARPERVLKHMHRGERERELRRMWGEPDLSTADVAAGSRRTAALLGV
jgi:hypothetical protein